LTRDARGHAAARARSDLLKTLINYAACYTGT